MEGGCSQYERAAELADMGQRASPAPGDQDGMEA